jgi:hypothetical protein
VRQSIFVLLLTVGTVVRLASLPLPGTEDVGTWRIWAHGAAQDVTAVYGVGGDPPIRGVLTFGRFDTTVDYPPLALYEMAVVGKVYRAFDPAFTNDWRLTVAVKVPGFIAGALLTALLYVSVLRFTRRTDLARWTAVAYWLNPATVLNGEVLGYLDPLVMLPAVGTFVALHAGRPTAAGLLMAAALLTKPQGTLVAPAVLLAAWHTGRWRAAAKTAAACVAGLVAGILPYVWVGALPNMLQAFGSWAGRRDILSGYAANFWWVVTWLARAWNMIPEYGLPGAYLAPVRRILAISSYMDLGLPDPRPFGVAMVAATCAWACWRARGGRDLGLHAALAAFVVQAYFVFAVSVHEHHLILAVPLLALASALRPAFRPIFVAVSLSCALNINMFYGISLGYGWAVPRTLTPVDASVLLAFVNVGLLAWHARVLARETTVRFDTLTAATRAC